MAQGLGVTDGEQLPVVAYVVRGLALCVYGVARILRDRRACWLPQEADREEQDRLRKRKLMQTLEGCQTEGQKILSVRKPAGVLEERLKT